MATGSITDTIRKKGGVVTQDIHEAIDLVSQPNGQTIVCLDQTVTPPTLDQSGNPPTLGPPLTRSEKDLIKLTMGGRREQTILSQILANRGGVIPSDWLKLVLDQGIWLER